MRKEVVIRETAPREGVSVSLKRGQSDSIVVAMGRGGRKAPLLGDLGSSRSNHRRTVLRCTSSSKEAERERLQPRQSVAKKQKINVWRRSVWQTP
jgi:hypothetical protein